MSLGHEAFHDFTDRRKLVKPRDALSRRFINEPLYLVLVDCRDHEIRIT